MPEFQSYSKNKSRHKSVVRAVQPHAENDYYPIKASVKTPGNSANKPQKRKVRQNYIIHAVLVSIVLVSVFAFLSVTVLFNAENVIIVGESAYSDEEIMAAGNIKAGANLIRFNSEIAEEKIISELVLLDSVTVKRQFPSSVKIIVEPAEKVLSVYSDGVYYGISKNRRIIEVDTKRRKGLVVSGIKPKNTEVGESLEYSAESEDKAETESPEKPEDYAENLEKIQLVYSLAELIEKHGLSKIVRIDVSDRYEIKMWGGEPRDERVEVNLGAATQLDEKLAVAAKIIADEIADNERGVLRVVSPRKASFNPNPR